MGVCGRERAVNTHALYTSQPAPPILGNWEKQPEIFKAQKSSALLSSSPCTRNDISSWQMFGSGNEFAMHTKAASGKYAAGGLATMQRCSTYCRKDHCTVCMGCGLTGGWGIVAIREVGCFFKNLNGKCNQEQLFFESTCISGKITLLFNPTQQEVGWEPPSLLVGSCAKLEKYSISHTRRKDFTRGTEPRKAE